MTGWEQPLLFTFSHKPSGYLWLGVDVCVRKQSDAEIMCLSLTYHLHYVYLAPSYSWRPHHFSPLLFQWRQHASKLQLREHHWYRVLHIKKLTFFNIKIKNTWIKKKYLSRRMRMGLHATLLSSQIAIHFTESDGIYNSNEWQCMYHTI